jgi:predicted dienelactone hydrolase
MDPAALRLTWDDDEVWMDGYYAGRRLGIYAAPAPLVTCPHPSGSDHSYLWIDGFEDGSDDLADAAG